MFQWFVLDFNVCALVGHDCRVAAPIVPFMEFQSMRPMWGAITSTDVVQFLCNISMYSPHVRRYGANIMILDDVIKFQSIRPCRAQHRGNVFIVTPCIISIYAPCVGRYYSPLSTPDLRNISIYVPQWGTTIAKVLHSTPSPFQCMRPCGALPLSASNVYGRV